jgi:ParB family chromosome partitioning protein
MARKLDAGEVTRSEVHNILPEHVVVDPSENSRVTPRTPEEVAAFAQRLLEDGQLQPVLVRVIEGNKVKLVAGYGRHEAATFINENLNPPQPFKLQCKIVDCNSEEAFLKSLKENIDRKDTNAIDEAHAQKRLREVFHWTEEQIAAFYEKSVAWVSQKRKLLQLSKPLQQEVISGNLSEAAALDLTAVPESEREAVVEEARGPDKKIKREKIKKKAREKQQETGTGTAKPLSLREFKDFLENNVGTVDWNDQTSIKELCNVFLDFIGGTKTEKQMTNSLKKNCK